MNLLLVRCARATPRRGGEHEVRRALTADGRDRFARQVDGLATRGVKLDRLCHSPWLRAVQTAELLTPLLRGETVVTPGLLRAPTPELLEAFEGDCVAVVGHEPWLGQLLATLVFGRPADGQRLVIKKGGLAWLEGEPRSRGMVLRSLLPPRGW